MDDDAVSIHAPAQRQVKTVAPLDPGPLAGPGPGNSHTRTKKSSRDAETSGSLTDFIGVDVNHLTASFEMTATETRNYWAKIAKTPNCWIWNGAKARGYGQFRVGAKTIGAHRISYMLSHGVIDGDLHVDHRCFNRACVNPAHLRAVSPKANQENRRSAQRNSNTGVRGVSFRKRSQRFEVCVQHNNKNHHGGSFATLPDAEQAAIRLRLKLFTCNDVDRAA